eukprot:Awhi_evm1s15166
MKRKEKKLVELSFSDGTKKSDFDLVVFADGYQSMGRTIINPGVQSAYRGFYLWRGLLDEKEMDLKSVREALGESLARITYTDSMKGTLIVYLVPGRNGSTQPGIYN